MDLRWNLDPVEASSQGVRDYDDRYGNYTAADVGAHIAALRSVAGTLEAVDVDELDDEIDRTALLGDVRVAINTFEREQPHRRNPSFWLNHVLEGLYVLMIRSDRTPEQRDKAVRSRLEDIPRFLEEARETLDKCPRVFVETALQVSQAAAELVRSASVVSGDGETKFGEAPEQAITALVEFTDFLNEDLMGNCEADFAIGEEAFNFRLHFEHALRATAPEIYRYGLRLVDEVEAEIADMAREMGHHGPWPDLVSRLRDDHPEAAGLVASYREQMTRSFEFVQENNLAPLPDGPLDVIVTPPFLRPMIPYAAYQSPGAFSEDRRGLFFVSVPEEEEDELRSRRLRDHCYYDLPAMSLHEGYPGHHLQLSLAQEQERVIRKVVTTPLMTEGWALYCEDLMAEEGFYQSPEEMLFQKVQLLWRAVRIVVDVGLHTRGMSFEEAVDLLVERAGLERASADAEVRRYCAFPAYQLCYALGRREIKDLRTSYEASVGSDFSLHGFHSKLLSYGSLPVNLARWGMGLD